MNKMLSIAHCIRCSIECVQLITGFTVIIVAISKIVTVGELLDYGGERDV